MGENTGKKEQREGGRGGGGAGGRKRTNRPGLLRIEVMPGTHSTTSFLAKTHASADKCQSTCRLFPTDRDDDVRRVNNAPAKCSRVSALHVERRRRIRDVPGGTVSVL